MIKTSPIASRCRRLRKKLRTEEFQHLGFNIEVSLLPHLNADQTEAFVDRFLAELIEPLGMAYGGWTAGLVMPDAQGSLSEQHRVLVSQWLSAAPEVTQYTVHPLSDCWYPQLGQGNTD